MKSRITAAMLATATLATSAFAQWDLTGEFRTPGGNRVNYEFAMSASIEGDVFAVGEKGEAFDGWDGGRVRTYFRSGGAWAEGPMIQRAEMQSGWGFGETLAQGGGLLFIGAPRYGEPREASGIVHCYRWNDGQWEYVQELLPASGLRYRQYYGDAMDTDGSRVIVGAPGDRTHAPFQGAAFVYEYNNGTFTEVARLEAPDGAENHAFGSDVAIDGDLIAVASSGDYVSGQYYGSVYIFESPDLVTKITQPTPGENEAFGRGSIALRGDTLAVGAIFSEGSEGPNVGKVYLFSRQGPGDWQLTQIVEADDAHDFSQFGEEVALSGDRLVIGTSEDDQPEHRCGGAYVFERTDGVWSQVQRLRQPVIHPADQFGEAVAIDGSTVVVGAPESYDYGRGAAYVFEGPATCVADWDGNGEINTLDFLAYLGDWAVGDTDADLDGDGTVDTLDFLMYLNAWAAGC